MTKPRPVTIAGRMLELGIKPEALAVAAGISMSTAVRLRRDNRIPRSVNDTKKVLAVLKLALTPDGAALVRLPA